MRSIKQRDIQIVSFLFRKCRFESREKDISKGAIPNNISQEEESIDKQRPIIGFWNEAVITGQFECHSLCQIDDKPSSVDSEVKPDLLYHKGGGDGRRWFSLYILL